MKNTIGMFMRILVAGILSQVILGNAFAANGANDNTNPGVPSQNGERPLVQPLTGDELKFLAAAENKSPLLLNQSAAGWQRDSVCQGSCGGGCGPCPGQGGSGGGSRGGTVASFAIAGAVLGSFAGATGVIVGTLASGLFAFVITAP